MRFCLFVDSVIFSNWRAAGLPFGEARASAAVLDTAPGNAVGSDKPLAVAVWDVLIFRAWTSRK